MSLPTEPPTTLSKAVLKNVCPWLSNVYFRTPLSRKNVSSFSYRHALDGEPAFSNGAAW
ncbi:hypothetical protein [Flavobacterium sp. 3HN19-14]|uniref:hypothetical protein n=1 Tax=Flavobacterium sp. 3HN19-14 TaxID=3448133 RepID=UPI003EE01D01